MGTTPKNPDLFCCHGDECDDLYGILHDFSVQWVDLWDPLVGPVAHWPQFPSESKKVPLESSIFDDIPMMIPMLYP
jgi:hypothetical protein